MVLNDIGKIAYNNWNEIPRHFINVSLDEFVIMPNHLHGIINIVETCHGMSLQKYNRFSKPISGSISMIVNHYKSAVKRWCNQNGFEYFQWQRNYYEHIIRNEYELNAIREYILNNPLNWNSDENNVKIWT